MFKNLRIKTAVLSLVVIMLVPSFTSFAASYKAPKATAKAQTATSIVVKWKKCSKATKYIIYRSRKKSKGYKKVKTLTKRSNGFNDKSVYPGKKYYYKVKAVYKKGSKTSKAVSATSGGVKGLTATGDINCSYVMWDEVPGATGYELYYSSTENGQYRLKKSGNITSFCDKSLPCGEAHYYKVRSYKTIKSVKYYSALSSKVSCNTQAHDFSISNVTVQPTCTTAGTNSRTCCHCGYTVYDSLPATGHCLKRGETIAPTCEKYGYTVYRCSLCCNTVAENFTPATGHCFVKDNGSCESSTCATNGKNVFVCTKCGVYYSEILPKTEHSFKEYTQQATCEDPGFTVYRCEFCGTEQGQRQNVTAPLGHNYEATEFDGQTFYRCTRCNSFKQQ